MKMVIFLAALHAISLPGQPESFLHTYPSSDSFPSTLTTASFSIPPAVIGGTTIIMTAATGSVAGGMVEYYFEEMTGNPGGDHSGWQSSPYYSDGGLLPNTIYKYRVIVRDFFKAASEPSQVSGALTKETEPWKNDLDYGAYYGYQAWHRGPEDNWSHWFDGGIPDETHMSGDNWPDLSEYPILYQTQLSYPDGSPVLVYSCNDYETVDVHIRWMKEYGLKGCFLQRQQLNIHNPETLEQMDRKALHVRRACEKYGIRFCMMPCNNDKSESGRGQEYIDNIIADWKHCVDDLKITESPMYMHQDGKPVIGFWGLGFANRQMTPEQANQILDSFQMPTDSKYRVYVMGGVPNDWRTKTKAGFMPVYERLDMISPWRPIFYDPYNQVWLDRMAGDKAFCDARGIDYNPTVSPGASVAYQNSDPSLRNKNPRDGGNYLWKQVYEVCKLKNKFIYVAMYDEIDEGTAMYKMAETIEYCPVVDPLLVPLNEDGYDLPDDWYLRIGSEIQKMIEGSSPLVSILPLKPSHAAVIPESMSEGKLLAYPNPSGNILNVEGVGTEPHYMIYGMTGVKVIEGIISQGRVDISSLPEGIYILSVNKLSFRFVKP